MVYRSLYCTRSNRLSFNEWKTKEEWNSWLLKSRLQDGVLFLTDEEGEVFHAIVVQEVCDPETDCSLGYIFYDLDYTTGDIDDGGNTWSRMSYIRTFLRSL